MNEMNLLAILIAVVLPILLLLLKVGILFSTWGVLIALRRFLISKTQESPKS